jgi:hypothetical protein
MEFPPQALPFQLDLPQGLNPTRAPMSATGETPLRVQEPEIMQK